eukprot:1817935-Prorocentrum_lima.AAC.1
MEGSAPGTPVLNLSFRGAGDRSWRFDGELDCSSPAIPLFTEGDLSSTIRDSWVDLSVLKGMPSAVTPKMGSRPR